MDLKMLYKMNKLFLLCLMVTFSEKSLHGIFGRFSAYTSKKLPAITALLKNSFKKVPTIPAGHIIYNKDGSEVYEKQFNEIKNEILIPNTFPTALKNPNYNPEADEIQVIKDKLDEKYQHEKHAIVRVDPFNEYTVTTASHTPKEMSVKWIPDTLHDLFRYKYSNNEYCPYKKRYTHKSDEYKINNIANDYIMKNPKKNNESDSDYYVRIAEPLTDFCVKDLIKDYRGFIDLSRYEETVMKKTIQDTITIEVDQHAKNANNALLYRGDGSLKDFNTDDAYDIGKNAKNAKCLKDNIKEGSSEMLSYGISLLSNSKQNGAGCPFFYTFRHEPKDLNTPNVLVPIADLQITSVPKKEFVQNKGHWFVNDEYDNYKSFHSYGVAFHPRRKTFTTIDNLLKSPYVEDGFKAGDPRIRAHKTMDEALADYAQAKEYHIHNTIGATPYTQEKINEAQRAFAQGKSDRNSWMKYIYAFLTGYLPK